MLVGSFHGNKDFNFNNKDTTFRILYYKFQYTDRIYLLRCVKAASEATLTYLRLVVVEISCTSPRPHVL